MKTTVKVLFSLIFVITLFSVFSISLSAKSAYDIECQNAEYADAIYFYSYDAKTVLYSKNVEKILAVTVRQVKLYVVAFYEVFRSIRLIRWWI